MSVWLSMSNGVREKLFPDVVDFSAKLDLPPSWHRPRVRLGEMSSSVHGHQADLADQVRTQFTRLQNEGNLVPWVLPQPMKPALADKLTGSFPPLIVYDSFQEANKIYRSSPRSRLRKDARKSPKERERGKLFGDVKCEVGLLDASRHNLHDNGNAPFKQSPTRLPRNADDSWAVLARALAKERVSRLTNDPKCEFVDLSRRKLQGNEKATSVSPSRILPPKMVGNRWTMLARRLATERRRLSKSDEVNVPSGTISHVSNSAVNLETSPGKTIQQGTTKGETSRPLATRPQGEEIESKSPLLRAQMPRKGNLKARESKSSFAKAQVDNGKLRSDNEVGIAATNCRNAQDDSTSVMSSMPTRITYEAEFAPKRSPTARGFPARDTDSKLHDRLMGEMAIPSISRRSQHDARPGLFLSPTISSQSKADARGSPIARALLKEKELKEREDLELNAKKREIVIPDRERASPSRLVRNSSRSAFANSSSPSSPCKADTSSLCNVETTTPLDLIKETMPADMERGLQQFPISKEIKPETPVHTTQLSKFQGVDSMPALASRSSNGYGELEDHSKQSIFTVCSRSSGPAAIVCEQSLTNVRGLRLFGRIIDDIWPLTTGRTETTC